MVADRLWSQTGIPLWESPCGNPRMGARPLSRHDRHAVTTVTPSRLLSRHGPYPVTFVTTVTTVTFVTALIPSRPLSRHAVTPVTPSRLLSRHAVTSVTFVTALIPSRPLSRHGISEHLAMSTVFFRMSPLD